MSLGNFEIYFLWLGGNHNNLEGWVTVGIVFAVVSSTVSLYLCKKRMEYNCRSNGERSNVVNDEENSLLSTTYLPSWLNDRRGVVFAREDIEKKEELGNGQYGVVYRGIYSQGNAL